MFHYFPVSQKTTKAPSKRAQHCCLLHCCVRLHILLHVVACCCAKFETGQTLQLRANGIKNSQQCRGLLARTMFRLFARKCEMLIEFQFAFCFTWSHCTVLSESLARLGESSLETNTALVIRCINGGEQVFLCDADNFSFLLLKKCLMRRWCFI